MTGQDELGNNTENVVSLSLTDEGTTKFAEATAKAYENSESIGIYYDGRFVSVPNVNNEITDGQAQITGMADAQEAEDLASTIRIGGLKSGTFRAALQCGSCSAWGRSYLYQRGGSSYRPGTDHFVYDHCLPGSWFCCRRGSGDLCVPGSDRSERL